MPEVIHLPLLDRIEIASPCPARWEDMVGDARVRHCCQCDLDVHNISMMTRDEAEGVLAKIAEGRVCARFFKRSDGTILTRDCPVGLAAARKRVLMAASRVAAAIGFAVLAGAAAKAAQDKNWGNWGWSMRLSNVAPVQWVACKVQQGWQAAFPSKIMAGQWLGGSIAGPPGEPPVSDKPFGPHAWEYRR